MRTNEQAIDDSFSHHRHKMQALSATNIYRSVQISHAEFIRELIEGHQSEQGDFLGKRLETSHFDSIVPLPSKTTSAATSLGSLPEPLPSENRSNFALTNLADSVQSDTRCSLSELEESSFMRALSSPLESTKALLKHFLYETLASGSLNIVTFQGLSDQVQKLVISFFQAHFGGLNTASFERYLTKCDQVPLEELLPININASAQESCTRRQYKLSIMLGCYLEGLKRQLAKGGAPADTRAAVKSLHSALHSGRSSQDDAEQKPHQPVDFQTFDSLVSSVLLRVASFEEMSTVKETLTSKLIAKFKKLPKKPLREEYNKSVAGTLSNIIDDCESFSDLQQAVRNDCSHLRVYLLSTVDPEFQQEHSM